MKKKLTSIFVLVLCMGLSTVALSEDDGWEIHAYGNMDFRVDENFASNSSNFGKADFFLGVNGLDPSSNQVEMIIAKKFKMNNGSWAKFETRSEYGNGEKAFYSSSGGQQSNSEYDFELKEAYIEMGGLSYLPEGASIWGGRKYHNRNATALSGEYYKQSSGVGFGYDNYKFGQNKDKYLGFAVVGADPDADLGPQGDTLLSFESYYGGVNIPGGSLDIAAKYYHQAGDHEKNEADDGFGVGVIYNTNLNSNKNFYGLADGWSQHSINYGHGLGSTAKGLNFGDWVAGADEDGDSILATSYGVGNFGEKWQIGTELSLHIGDKLYGQEDITRFGASIKPSYKVNENFRMEFGAGIGIQELSDYEAWGKSDGTEIRTALSVAPTFTIDNDFYGRPQIQPYITYIRTDDDNGLGHDERDKDEFLFGVKAEIWF